MRLIGSGTTIWAKSDAVIEINAAGVSLENLRVELTEGSTADAAIVSGYPTAVRDVEVLGAVSGFGAADGYFDVPRTIDLGTFAAEETNTFTLAVNVPERTEIVCGVRDAAFSPTVLEAGRNTLEITVSGISAQTLLYAETLFRSTFTRRIYLSGKPANVPAVSGKCVYTAPERAENKSENAANASATDVISLTRSQPQTPVTGERLVLKRGQRIAPSQYIGASFSVFFDGSVPAGWELDPYVFLVDENNRVLDDNCLVFFGNERSPNGEAAYFPRDGHVEIDLSRVDRRIARIVLAYSIYAGNEIRNFSGVKDPRVIIRDSEERISFPMDGLTSETTVVAMEFYLYKGEWKISAVGAGYNDGMAKLCNSYGLEVI